MHLPPLTKMPEFRVIDLPSAEDLKNVPEDFPVVAVEIIEPVELSGVLFSYGDAELEEHNGHYKANYNILYYPPSVVFTPVLLERLDEVVTMIFTAIIDEILEDEEL